MSIIKVISIDKRNLALQILCAVLILAACFISKSLVLVAGVISMAYIFSGAKWEQKFAFFMFMLSFSPIFKFNKDQTSLFMFLRLAVVISYVFQQKGKFSFTFITLLISFSAYCLILSEMYETEYLIALINIVLWYMIGYIIAVTLNIETVTPVVKSLVNGVILTGIIGLFIKDIPQLAAQIDILSIYAEDGALVYRFAGFWVDPNYYTVLLVASLWTVYFEYNKKRVVFLEFVTRCLLVTFIGTMTMSKSCILMLVVFWLYVVIAKNDIKIASKVTMVFLMIFAVIFFLYKNPYWISDMFYRFGSSSEEITAQTITTGRSVLWVEYLERMLDDFSWIFGHGLKAKLYSINGVLKGSHNTYIQMIFNFGVLGTLLYISIFRNIFVNAKTLMPKNSTYYGKRKNIGKIALLAIFATLFFLDGIYIEMYYYMIPLTFVYILDNTETSEIEEHVQLQLNR